MSTRPLRACVQCGRPTSQGARCELHAIPPRPRSRATQKQTRAIIAAATHCHICGRPFDNPHDPPVADHIVPRARGGPDTIDNLAAAHRSCNGRKGAGVGNHGDWSR
jgi:5-methylcytosine-specific restriction endonuclease McrA